MSGEDATKAMWKYIEQVQNLVERCIQLYMSQKEVVDFLQKQAKIKPEITQLVWQRLEKENPKFFKAYHSRLVVKDSILRFNELLEKQAEHMHLIPPHKITSNSSSNDSQMTPPSFYPAPPRS